MATVPHNIGPPELLRKSAKEVEEAGKRRRAWRELEEALERSAALERESERK